MKPKEIYGLSRSRDKTGKVVKRSLNPYVNCLHTQVGGARDNMEIYVIEIMEKENIVEPLNPYEDGTARTIKSQYYKNGRANFARQDGLGATGVVQIGNIYPDTDNFKNRTSGRVNSAEGLSPTLRTVTGGHNEPKVVEQKQQRYRIRKLTPREVFRLMDVDDADIDKIQAVGISNSQQYKLAGNSIVVNVLYHLFRKMFVETENESQQLTLF